MTAKFFLIKSSSMSVGTISPSLVRILIGTNWMLPSKSLPEPEVW